MDYTRISVYPIKLLERAQSLNLSFDELCEWVNKNVYRFSPEQIEMIESHLANRGFIQKNKSKKRKEYVHKEYTSVSVQQISYALIFFVENREHEAVLTALLTAGQFSNYLGLKGHFCVFDPTNGGWQY